MKRVVALVAAAAVSACAPAMTADEPCGRVSVPLPAGFKEAYRVGGATPALVEYLPADQTLDDWTEMITIREGGTTTLSFTAFFEQAGSGLVRQCAVAPIVSAPEFRRYGRRPAGIQRMSCGRSKRDDVAETTVYQAIQSDGMYVLVMWTWRFPPAMQSSDLPFTPAMRDEAQALHHSVTFCRCGPPGRCESSVPAAGPDPGMLRAGNREAG